MTLSQMLRLSPSPAVLLQVVTCTQEFDFTLVSVMVQVAFQTVNIALAHYSVTHFISSHHRAMAAWKSDQHAINVLTHKALKTIH